MNDHRDIPVTDTTTTNNSYSSSNNNNNNNNPYVRMSPAPHSSARANNRPNPMDSISDGLNRYSKKVEKATKQAEIRVDNFWNHIRMGSSPADAAIARIVQGTKMLTNGGSEKLFQQTFGFLHGEKLLKPFVCYISTTTGPVIGTLYVTNKRLAFCSDYPLCHYPFSLQHQCLYYKVVVELDQLRTVSPSTNRFNPAEKYMQVVTVDGYEFYFMGFISYDKALKTLNEALHQYRNQSYGNVRVQLQ